MRIAFLGASGTGKTTLTTAIAKIRDLPICPVGSRSVAQAMGFVHPPGHAQEGQGNPYAVDRAEAANYEISLQDGAPPLSAARRACASWSQGARTVRPAFQLRLQAEKIAWELDHADFVSDRTTLDDLAYAILHCREVVDAAFLERAREHMNVYDAVFYCPWYAFHDLGGDASRVADEAYHEVYDALVRGLVEQIAPRFSERLVMLEQGSLDWRMAVIRYRAETL